MVYIYRRKPSEGAVALAAMLGGMKIRRLSGRRFTLADHIICWGEEGGPHRGEVNWVNGGSLRSKYRDALTLLGAGVPTIEVSTTPIEGWLGRKFHHVGGSDLLNPPERPDFYVKREALTKEYRVHSFDSKSIRAGQKVPAAGLEAPHEWIRSYDGRWRIAYHGRGIRQRHRDLAHQAVQALGLTFGAVDIGERADRSLLVLEVNRAPGLEGKTIAAYAAAIQRLIGGVNEADIRVEERDGE